MLKMSFVAGSLLLSSALVPMGAQAQDARPQVVATFSILGDIVARVGGERIDLTTIVGPAADTHVYEPVPADVVAVAGADLVVVNGLGFEGFLDRLIAASATQAQVVVVSEGIDVLETAMSDEDDHDEHAHDSHAEDEHGHDDHDHDEHGHDEHGHDEHAQDGHDGHDHGPTDPHAWQSIDAVTIYVANIANALCGVDEDGCPVFRANAQAYAGELAGLKAEILGGLADIAPSERILITSHDAFGYLAREFDLTILSPQGVSTDSEASAGDVAALIDQIRETGARALFVENISDPRLLEQIAGETGLSVSGRLYSDALSEPEGAAPTYIDLMRTNMSAITAALAGS